MFDLAVIGHVLKERIVFPDGKEIGPLLGSPAAYGSVAAARLNLKVGIVTKVGKDMPDELINILRQAGVDVQGLKVGAKTTANRLIYDRGGQKRLEFLSKADDILPEDIPAGYLDAACFLVAPIDYEVGEVLLKHLYDHKKMLSAELSGFGGASSSKKDGRSPAEKVEYLRKLMPYFRIVKAGAEDCRCLFGSRFDAKEIAGQFLDWGTQIAIITRGEKGVLVAARGSPGSSAMTSFESPAFPVAAVDCTGAGDVWHAGFLYEYLKNKDLERAAKFANALSSIVIEKSGGVTPGRFPDAGRVYERIKNFKGGAKT